jgi:hypothetical protein
MILLRTSSASVKNESTQEQSLVDAPIAQPLDALKILGDRNAIFDPDQLPQTVMHLHEQTHRELYLLNEKELAIVENLISLFQEAALTGGDQATYLIVDEAGNSLQITKAIDISSPDYMQSHNQVRMQVGTLVLDWYFLLEDGGETVQSETYYNESKPLTANNGTQAESNSEKGQNSASPVTSTPPRIRYEYDEANKNEFNNTGYKFWRSDGKPLSHSEVTKFIRTMKKSGDPRFIRDFPDHVPDGQEHPMYEVVNSKYTYYVHSFDLDPLNDSDNLKSDLFSGVIELEAVHDGSLTLYKTSVGAYVNVLRKGINEYYAVNKVLVQIPEGTSYDEALTQRIRKFQELEGLPVDGKLGQATVDRLDEWLAERDAADAEEAKKKTAASTVTASAASTDQYSSTTLVLELTKLIDAVKSKDKKEVIYAIGEILYQLKLLYNETNDANPRLKQAQIEAAKLLIIPFRAAAEAWVPKDAKDYGWYDLMMIWFFELKDNPLFIKDKDAVTIRDLRAHEGIVLLRTQAEALIANEKQIGEEEYEADLSYIWNYRFSHMEKNIQEMKSLDPGQVNSLELFMGTYEAKVHVVKEKGKEAKMSFEVINTSHMESATRFRREETKGSGQQGIISDLPQKTGVGLGGDLKVIFGWEE